MAPPFPTVPPNGLVQNYQKANNSNVSTVSESSPSPDDNNNDDDDNDADAFPTEARLRQKERLKKEKEEGKKPTKRKKTVEAGHDDCGDDISGLGSDVTLLTMDWGPEDVDESDDDDNDEIFLTIPHAPSDGITNIYSAVSTLCYGKHNKVDLLELCGGEGRISQVAFRRGLEPGGNLDLVTGCHLGDPATQRAINHYLDVCDVLVTILQPNCRSTGRNSYFNSMMHYDT